MQNVVISRPLELSASKVSLSWLVFWWLTCVSVLFYFLFFFFFLFFYFIYFLLVLYLDFFECFSILIFSCWVYLLILSYAQSVSFTCFKVCLHSRLSFVQSHLRLFCFSAMQSHNLHAVTQKLVV